MPFAFLIVGIVFLIAGVRGEQDKLFTLLRSDFSQTGDKSSFIPWLVSILIVGSVGYIEPLKPLSRAFLVLLVVVLFLSNGGFFQQFTQQIYNPSQQQETKTQ